MKAGGRNLLIDAGISLKEIIKRSEIASIDLSQVTDCLITHEHIDHIRGVKGLAKNSSCEVWATEETLNSLDEVERKQTLIPNEPITLGEAVVTPIRISHDAKSPVGYLIEDEKSRALVLTDTGKRPVNLDQYINNLDLVVLEANHNVRMLQTGPYPWSLKKRIMSVYGHLSNQDSGKILSDIVRQAPKTPFCFLAHLSEENNKPQIALLDVATTLKEEGITPGKDVSLQVANQYIPSKVICF